MAVVQTIVLVLALLQASSAQLRGDNVEYRPGELYAHVWMAYVQLILHTCCPNYCIIAYDHPRRTPDVYTTEL